MKLGFKIILGILFLGLSGCYTPNGISIPKDIKTISVGFFTTETPLASPGLSQRFTEGLRSKFQNESKLNMVQDEGDIVITGKITDYKVEPVAISGNSGATKNSFTISYSVKCESEKNKSYNYDQVFTSAVTFDASKNFQSVETSLQEEINKNIIQQIFNRTLLNNW